MLNYSGLRLFKKLIPQLLPRHFKSIQKHSDEALAHIEEALTSDPWIFGYYNVSRFATISFVIFHPLANFHWKARFVSEASLDQGNVRQF